jgi:hypothetical protein
MTWSPDQLHERFINPLRERSSWHPCQKQTKNGQYNLKNQCACGRNRLSVSVSVHLAHAYSDFFFTNTQTHTFSHAHSLFLALSLSRVRSIFTCIPQDHDLVLDSMPGNAHSAKEICRDFLAISTSVPRGSGDTARASRYHNPPPSNGSCGSLKGR